MSDEALRQMERYAERCDCREGRCKSCGNSLVLVAEVKRLRAEVKRLSDTPTTGIHARS